jgi:hypothetical protein
MFMKYHQGIMLCKLWLDGNWSERCVYVPYLCIPQLMYSTYSIKINCVVRNYLNGREKLSLTKI